MQKDKLVYSTDKETQLDAERIRRKIAHAIDEHDQRAYERILVEELGVDPDGKSFQVRIESFRRACNLD